ncbi:MAG: aldehyde ferredoxin oxidoreductase [Candidatus Heimdallarchaeota archaeon]|nr:aldehyde ferredoxin oxidoreductase [Candidatus Heimdallarchaeota archaeon]
MSGKILRIDMKNLSSKWEDVPDKYKYLGGRGMTSNIINDEVPALTEPLGGKNKFVVAPGIVTGTTAPSSGRLSVGGKSPLTGGIKEANAGGRTPHKLARAGVKALIIENQPSDNDAWYNIHIKKNDVEIVQANDFKMMGAYDLIKKLWDANGNKPGIIGSGIAGQLKLKGAGVFGNNVENSDPGRYAGRGGLGAVLGSKNVIAIVTDDSGAEVRKPVDADKFKAGAKKLRDALTGHAVTGDNGGLQNYGTNVLMNILNEAGGLPSMNWTKGSFAGASKISGEAVHERIDLMKEKYGDDTDAQYAHACHPGCVMKCSNVVPRADGSTHVSPLEYESSWSLGTNCGIDNLDDVLELNRLCNDLGLDTIEMGNAIAVAMDGGVLEFGDGKGAIELLKEVGKGTAKGRVIGSGALTTGNVFGVSRVGHVKGQSMPAYDPRAVKGIGVTYATNPMGGDHTAGYTIAAEVLGIKGEVTDPRALDKAGLSKAFQETTAYIDSTGYCLFTAFAILDVDEGFAGMNETVEAMFGAEFSLADVTKYGRDILNAELDFNARAGFTKLDDRLPEFMQTEAIPPLNVTFDVTDEELDKVHGK